MLYDGLDTDTIEIATQEDIINHRLIPLSLYYSSSDNVYTLKSESYSSSFKVQDHQLKLLLRRMKAKDDITVPRKKRLVTYQSIIDNIKQNKNNTIYVWKSSSIHNEDELKSYLS
jgi:hypothetical protein